MLGSPVEHSRSPELHHCAYAHLGQAWTYHKRQVVPEQLEATLQELASPELLGINLTLPLKEVALPHLVGMTPEAASIGAVNCLRRDQDGWWGHNSDAPGWLDSWNDEIGLPLLERKCILLGAGGAARAIAYVLRTQGARVVVLNRTLERARALGFEVADWSTSGLAAQLEPGCVVINTTSVGMWPRVEEIPLEWPEPLPEDLIAVDLIYNPRPTRWLLQSGRRWLDGSGMLVYQALRAIEWWSGQRAPAQPLLDLLRQG